jgi:hypothetical protein
MKRKILICLFILILAAPPPSHALIKRSDTARFASGLTRALFSPLQIPLQALKGTTNGPPIAGTLIGLVSGTFGTVTNLVGGTFEMVGAAAPYAKYGLLAL